MFVTVYPQGYCTMVCLCPYFRNYKSDWGHIFRIGGVYLWLGPYKHDLHPDLDRACRIFSLFFFKNILHLLHTQSDSTEDFIQRTRKVCSRVIKCKLIEVEELRGQCDGHSEKPLLESQTTRPRI